MLDENTIAPKIAGEVFDEKRKFIGRYIYIEPTHQDALDILFTSWLETYESNQDFFITLDLETTGLLPNQGEILLVSICHDGVNAIVFSPKDFNLTLFKEVINTIPINNQNIKFDLKWLVYHYQCEPKIYLDTMVGCQLGWAGVFPSTPQSTFGLGNIAKNLLNGYDLEKATRKEFIGMTFEDGFTTKQIEYAAKDSIITHKLVKPIIKRLKNHHLWDLWEEIEKPLINVMVKAELKGIKIDIDELNCLLVTKEIEIAEQFDIIQEEVSKIPVNFLPKMPQGFFNPGSPKQIVDVLQAVGIKVLNTAKDTLQTTQAEHNHRLLGAIIAWKKEKSVVSKFLEAWLNKHIDPLTGCIYTSFGTCGAETGRLTASEPNVMAIDKNLRSMIIARKDYKILSLDYSQFELRAAAAITQEDYLISAFNDRADLLPNILEVAKQYDYIDPDSFVKAVTEGVKIKDVKKKLTLANAEQYKLVDDFALTDIHRRNAALILNLPLPAVTSEHRSLGKCVDINSYVHTDKGIISLRNLLPKKPQKDTYYTLKDMKILTDEGYQDSPSVYYNGKQKTIKITTTDGRVINCTPNHKLRSIVKSKYDWVQAQDIKPISDLFIQVGAPYMGKLSKFPMKLKTLEQVQSLAQLVGLIFNYGSITKESFLMPAVFEEKVKECLSVLGFNKIKTKQPKKDDLMIFNIPTVAEYIKTLDSLPEYFLSNCHEDVLLPLLDGLSIHCNKGVKFSYENPLILNQIQNLLLRIGIDSYITTRLHNACGIPSLCLSSFEQKLLKAKIFDTELPKRTEFRQLLISAPKVVHTKLLEFSDEFTSEKLSDQEWKIIELILTKKELETLKLLVSRNLRRIDIASIETSSVETADVSVPYNSTVVYNGIVSHNTLGYSVLYGGQAGRIQQSLAKEGFYYQLKDCEAFYNGFFSNLPKLKKFIEECHKQVFNPKYITTVLGRKRFFELPPKYLTRKYKQVSESECRAGVNFVFQGANADATKKAMVILDEIFQSYPPEVRPSILMSVHDEIVIEAHDSNCEEIAEIAKKVMISCGLDAVNHLVPIEVSVSLSSAWSK